MSRVIGHPCPSDHRRRLSKRLEEIGMVALAREIGMSRLTLARAIAGIPILNGSDALVDKWIAKRAAVAAAARVARKIKKAS